MLIKWRSRPIRSAFEAKEPISVALRDASDKHQFENSFVLTSDILKIEKKSSQALIEIL